MKLRKSELKVVALLGSSPGVDAEEVGIRAGPSWRSGATWAGAYLRGLINKGVVARYSSRHGRFLYRLTDLGNTVYARLGTPELAEASWDHQKAKAVAVLKTLLASGDGLTQEELVAAIGPGRSREWLGTAVRKLVRMKLVRYSERRSVGRPARVYTVTLLGRRALREAYSTGSSIDSLDVPEREPEQRPPDGNAPG
jgi:DNA-binding HxlR family transcriptional regulator